MDGRNRNAFYRWMEKLKPRKIKKEKESEHTVHSLVSSCARESLERTEKPFLSSFVCVFPLTPCLTGVCSPDSGLMIFCPFLLSCVFLPLLPSFPLSFAVLFSSALFAATDFAIRMRSHSPLFHGGWNFSVGKKGKETREDDDEKKRKNKEHSEEKEEEN